MSLGILDNISSLYAQNYLNQTQASLQNVLEQLSSGSRLNTGADDAAGLAVVSGLNANEAALTQSAQNATNGIGLLQTADSSLAQVTNLLTRGVTLATEAANGTLNPNQVSSANAEYTNILTEIGNIGSSTNFNGNQVFSASGQTLFVSDGTATGADSFTDTVGILTTASVGQAVPTGTTSTSAITNPTPTAAGAASPSTSTVTVAAAADDLVGTISLALGSNAAHSLVIPSVANGGDTIAHVAADINADATFASEGITASAAGAVLTISGPANGSATLSIGAATNLTDFGTGAVTPTTPTTAATGGSTASFTLGASTNTLAGTLSVQVTGSAAHAITVNAGTTGSQLAAQINSDTTFAGYGVTAAFTNSTLVITGPTGAGKTLVVTPTSLTQTTVLTPGPGVSFTGSASSLTQANAASDLVTLTGAIADVAYQRGVLGAEVNTLTAASNVASAENVNLTAASSAIESTNYGQATSDLAKYEVLSQTGISALAQANTVQQEILKLLQ
jgi:flagellin